MDLTAVPLTGRPLATATGEMRALEVYRNGGYVLYHIPHALRQIGLQPTFLPLAV